jgi:Tetratricopeptide repeat
MANPTCPSTAQGGSPPMSSPLLPAPPSQPASRPRAARGAGLGPRVTRLAATIVLLLATGAARGAEPGDAKARYLSGQSHYNLNEFADALQDFKEAYRLHPDAAFLFNIAQCERQLGDLEEAIKFYRSYLRNKPEASNKREVERKIEELKGLVEAKKKATTGAPQSVIPPSAVDEPGAGRGPAARSTDPDRSTSHEPPAATTTPATTSIVPLAPVSPSPVSAPPPAPAAPSSLEAAPEAHPGVDLTAHPLAADGAAATPIYRKWWFWAGAGALVVGLGVVAVAALSGGVHPPASGLGNQKVF